MGSLSREPLDALGTPIPVWEMVDSMLGDFFGSGCIRARKFLSSSGLFHRGLDLNFTRLLSGDSTGGALALGHGRKGSTLTHKYATALATATASPVSKALR